MSQNGREKESGRKKERQSVLERGANKERRERARMTDYRARVRQGEVRRERVREDEV